MIPPVPAGGPAERGPFLAVPSVEKGRGGGHLSRCIALVREARALGREAFLFPCGPYKPGVPSPAAAGAPGSGIPPAGIAPGIAQGIAGGNAVDPSWLTMAPEGKVWDFIVLDRFQTPPGEYRFWSSLAPLIGIDEGGPCRGRFDFLLDLLPGPPGRSPPNILDPGFLPLPRRRPPADREAGPLRVLISFGAEDSAGLGRQCAAALCAPGGSPSPGEDHAAAGPRGEPEFQITLLDPQGAWPAENRGRLRVLRAIPSLGEHLAEYDLLVTHFGLSAFEALHAGIPVLLVSPGPYHQRLARTAGFVSAGIGAPGARRLGRRLSRCRDVRGRAFRDLEERCRSLARRHGVAGERKSFAGFMDALRPQFLVRRCPCCGDSAGPVLARFPRQSFRRCPRCGLIYQARIDEAPIEYKGEYFFELYRRQYGRTYLEDFPNLLSMAERRLARIFPLLPGDLFPGAPGKPERPPLKLLDIGCAYGAFLQAASRSGFDVLGLDPAEDAVRYVRDTLGLPARRGFFPSGDTAGTPPGPAASFSVLSLWYVIEHFPDPAGALEEGRRLLREGGVLAFSTPSFSGISGRSSLKTFLEKSPGDHWTIWSPRICRKILRRHGFRVKKILITGHHPERFPLLGPRCGKGPVYRFLSLLSRIFGLGDTFEVYAVKESR